MVAAIGRPRFVTVAMVKPGAVVIDVEITRDAGTGKLCGDVDFDTVRPLAGSIDPVTEGVGPMTIAMRPANTVQPSKKSAPWQQVTSTRCRLTKRHEPPNTFQPNAAAHSP